MIKNEIIEVISMGNKREYRKFGITIGLVLSLISAFLCWSAKAGDLYVLGVGLLLIVLGLLIPQVLKYVYVAWMVFSVVLGFFMSRVLLSLLFFLLFAPVGMITRLLGKDLLKEKWDKNTKSYWIKRERKTYDPEFAEKQY